MPAKNATKSVATKAAKAPKDPNAPKAPRNAYFLWVDANRESLKKKNPTLSPKEVNALAGQTWKDMADGAKKKWVAMYEKAKAEYLEEKAAYEGNAAKPAKGRGKGKAAKPVEEPEEEVEAEESSGSKGKGKTAKPKVEEPAEEVEEVEASEVFLVFHVVRKSAKAAAVDPMTGKFEKAFSSLEKAKEYLNSTYEKPVIRQRADNTSLDYYFVKKIKVE